MSEQDDDVLGYPDPNDFPDGPIEDYGDKDARPA